MSRDPTKDRSAVAARWVSVGLATIVMFCSYVMFLFGFGAISNDESVFGGGVIGIALGLVPAVFLVASAVSNRAHPIRGGLLATGLWLIIGVPVAIIDIPTGLVAGFGAGGVVAIRREEHHAVSYRIAAVAVCVAYTFLVQRIVPAAGLLVGAVIPLVAVVLADLTQEEEAEALV